MSTMNERAGTHRWLGPGLCGLAAAGYAAVFPARGEPPAALITAGLMAAYGLVLVVFSRRSETVALLRDEAPDERRTAITMRAAATTAYTMVLVSIVMLFVQLARSGDAGAWGVECAIGGPTSILATAYHSRRS